MPSQLKANQLPISVFAVPDMSWLHANLLTEGNFHFLDFHHRVRRLGLLHGTIESRAVGLVHLLRPWHPRLAATDHFDPQLVHTQVALVSIDICST